MKILIPYSDGNHVVNQHEQQLTFFFLTTTDCQQSCIYLSLGGQTLYLASFKVNPKQTMEIILLKKTLPLSLACL